MMLLTCFYLAAWGVLAGVSGWAAWLVADQKRRSTTEGLLLGAVLGPLGLAAEALLPVGEGFGEDEAW